MIGHKNISASLGEVFPSFYVQGHIKNLYNGPGKVHIFLITMVIENGIIHKINPQNL